MVGKKFNKWTVIDKAAPYKWQGKNLTRWLCRCECENTSVVRECALKGNRTQGCKSCGTTKHGHTKASKGLYQSWADMKTRCNNSKIKQYHNYGGRGITFCDRWSKFENFLEDMGAAWSQGLTIDRIDNDGNYELSNCRWVTRKEQFKSRNPKRTALTNTQIEKIKTYKENGISAEHIAQLFNISKSHVYNVLEFDS